MDHVFSTRASKGQTAHPHIFYACIRCMYFINVLIGGEANYWYLMDRPAGESLMDLMPDPPFHILGVAPLALAVFFLTYVPFLLWDQFKKA